MKKAIVEKEVSHCGECPHSEYVSGEESYVLYCFFKSDSHKTKFLILPDWCPLGDI